MLCFSWLISSWRADLACASFLNSDCKIESYFFYADFLSIPVFRDFDSANDFYLRYSLFIGIYDLTFDKSSSFFPDA